MSMSTFGISFYSLKCWIASVKLLVRALLQGENFHLKVGGAKSSGNAGDPCSQWWIRDLQKGGGHKIMDACCLYDHTFII